MKLPPFVLKPFELKKGSAYIIPLPKPSTGLLVKIHKLMKDMGFSDLHGKFRKGKRFAYLSLRGFLLINFEPSELLRELDKIKWSEFVELSGLTPTWDNAYFKRLKSGIRLHLRINLSKREFWRFVGMDRGFVLPDEAYLVLKLAINSHKFKMISYKTYSADEAEFVRHSGQFSFYRLEFSNSSIRASVEEVWEDVLSGRPTLLPEPGTNEFKMDIGVIDLESLFTGLDEWCLSDKNLALPLLDYPSIHTS